MSSRPPLLVVLAWIALGSWLLLSRGLTPGPALPPGVGGEPR